MVFNLIVSKRAQFEIENAVEYFAEININLASKFYVQLNSAYQNITVNPYYQKRYKNFRGITITNFPFILFFIIEKTTTTNKNSLLFPYVKRFKKVSEIVYYYEKKHTTFKVRS